MILADIVVPLFLVCMMWFIDSVLIKAHGPSKSKRVFLLSFVSMVCLLLALAYVLGRIKGNI